jgi:hypothetical protein
VKASDPGAVLHSGPIQRRRILGPFIDAVPTAIAEHLAIIEA